MSKLTGEQLNLDYQTWWGLYTEDYEGEEYELVYHENDWIQDGKYQSLEMLIRRKSDGKVFVGHIVRSGSYHTDWYYCNEDSPLEFFECKEVQTITYEWKPF